MKRENHGSGPRERDRRRRNPLETAVLAASALLVVASIVVLARQGARDERPPEIETRVDSIVTRGAAYHVHVTVTNVGDIAAARAQLRGRLLRASTVAAESQTTLDWVPGRSSTSATLVFEQDPRAHEVEARVVGFSAP